ncbi:PIN domain-containing protein [Candidatus Albibeggiatoa sp. nov. BB20]|uniref:type II toxin-antitoxin system VapC family toxin n=1 Tax=Candidatus Albibeggiatoa sp. nov. BB20 TaxID=3162723 RepID=UPI0033659B60
MLITDTGFWLALANKKDCFHKQAKQKLEHLTHTNNLQFITTCAVVNETSYLLYQRVNHQAQQQFLAHYQNELFQVFNIQPAHIPRLRVLMDKYADLPMDFADASLVILAEYLGHGQILSTDLRDFGAYRWKNHYPFENILLD